MPKAYILSVRLSSSVLVHWNMYNLVFLKIVHNLIIPRPCDSVLVHGNWSINLNCMEYKHEYGVELEELIRKVSKDKNNAFLREFLFDLLSAAEYRDLAIRWQIIKMLNAKVPHRDISKKLKVGLATINRGVAELANKKGGFKMALNKYQKKSSV